MIKDLREKGLLLSKSKEDNGGGGSGAAAGGEPSNKAPPPTGLRSWLGLKDPRIVRVSRTFGGKDRHSKVSTVRGLRDRRVRLSVPTAIQLYELQDRLGLNQPSKVVDWLLNATQQEIDKLPPLQIPPGAFAQLTQSMSMAAAAAAAAGAAPPHDQLASTAAAAAAAPTTTLRMANTDYMEEEEQEEEEDGPGSSLTLLCSKSSGTALMNHHATHGNLAEQSPANWRPRMEQEEGGRVLLMQQPLAIDDLFPRNSSGSSGNNSTVNALPISSSAGVYAAYYHMEPLPSHAAAAAAAGGGLMYHHPSPREEPHHHHHHHHNAYHQHLPSSLSLLPAGSQLMLQCGGPPSGPVPTTSILQPYYTPAAAAGDYDPKHNHLFHHMAPSASHISFFGSPNPASFIPNSSFTSDQQLFKPSSPNFSKPQHK